MKMLSDKSLQILGMAAYDIVEECEQEELTFTLLQSVIFELRALEADDDFKEQNGLPMKSDHLKGAGLGYRINEIVRPWMKDSVVKVVDQSRQKCVIGAKK